MTAQTILVTGATGFIGSRVVRLLCTTGYRVRAFVRPTSDRARLAQLPAEYVVGDICDGARVHEAMVDVDAWIHLAAVVGWHEMQDGAIERTIVDGTRNVLAAAKARGVHGVYVSSAAAVNASDAPEIFTEQSEFALPVDAHLDYAFAKHRAERIVLAAVAEGASALVVNPVETYGPGDDRLITACNLIDILKLWPCVVCTGGSAIAHVDDVADGIVRALEKGRSGERYILGGDNVTVEDMARLVLAAAERDVPIVKLPNAALRAVVRGCRRLRLPTPIHPGVLEYATRFWFVSCAKAKRELGYQSRPARDVLTPTVRWLQDAGLA